MNSGVPRNFTTLRTNRAGFVFTGSGFSLNCDFRRPDGERLVEAATLPRVVKNQIEDKGRLLSSFCTMTAQKWPSLCAPAFDQRFQQRPQRDFSLARSRFAALELDPPFVEAIEHPNARCGILHAL